jgi:hypothetical protein
MHGILIQYDYDGDEAAWLAAVEDFVAAIDNDTALHGKFSYRVNIAPDGIGRVHVGGWDSDETLAHLQSQDFFKTFAGKVGEFAGGNQKATRIKLAAETAR